MLRYKVVHPFIFVPTFPLRRMAVTAVLGGLEIPHGQHQSQKFCCLHTNTGSKQGWRCSHST